MLIKNLLALSFTLFFTSNTYANYLCISFLKSDVSSFAVATEEPDHRTIDQDNITWEQNYDSGFFNFSAYLDPLGTMSFNTYLVDYDKRIRSSLRGSKLFAKTIKFFSKKRIERIQARWFDTSDNHLQFMIALSEGYSPEEAALRTWTGRLAAAHGFKVVTSVEEKVLNPILGIKTLEVTFEKAPGFFSFLK